MKDISYYAGFLKPKTQEEIRNAPLWKLSLTISAVGEFFADKFYYADDSIEDEFCTAIDDESEISDRDKLALIRGLCDRIEIKLMQQAN